MNLQEFRADLHIHSRFSRATSSRLNLPLLAAWGAIKGITVLGTGDFTHPQWRDELKSGLVLEEKSGLYALKNPEEAEKMLPEWATSPLLREKAAEVRFLPQAEISSIYKRGGKVRKVHNLVYVPHLEAADALSLRLEQVGNLASDGRPILGLDSRNLLEMVLNLDSRAFLVPAHIWTPWFSIFGSKSGFDSLEECFGSLSGEIFALETGLSSDPEMNRCLSALDGLRLISNSDAHSGENLAREANIFAGEISYQGIFDALRGGKKATGGEGVTFADTADNQAAVLSSQATRFVGTFEFFPDEGKYHLDGHRDCKVSLTPIETRELGGICPVCDKPVTVGVLNRVQELADRSEAVYRADESFTSLIPLPELLGEVLCVGAKSRKVGDFYRSLVSDLGPELDILNQATPEDIARHSRPLAEGIARMRRGEVHRRGGFDGEFGVISVFTPEEHKELKGRRLISVGTQSATSLNLLSDAAEAPATSANEPVRADTPISSVIVKAPANVPVNDPVTTGVPPAVASAKDSTAAGSDKADPEPAERGLNAAQVKAVKAGPGATLVIAGPGTGKTHTLIARILHLLQTGVPAGNILALTFTRRAAEELRERLSSALQNSAELPRTDTLHALALEFWCRIQGGPPVLLTEESALRVFAEANIEESAARRRAAWEAINLSREKNEPLAEEWREFHNNYTGHKTAWNLADYTDLLELWLTQLKTGRYPATWTEILVDEIQDLSPLQLELVKNLTQPGGYGFFGIGDPDQSIYGFRGAHGRADEFFKEAWPGLERIQLNENYRSGPEILDLAQTLYQQKADRLLVPAASSGGRGKAGDPGLAEIHFFEGNSSESEATWVAGQIRSLLGATSHTLLDASAKRAGHDSRLEPGGYSPGDIAILVRSRLFMPPLRRALERAGIPCGQPSVDPFWNEPRIAKILEVAGRVFGISPSLADSGQTGRGKQLECPDRVLTRGPLSMHAYWGNSEPFDSQFWQSEAFKDFSRAFEAQHGWSGLFNWLSLQNELELVRVKSERVQLITIHAAKGLEFPIVFLPALEDGILPFAGASFLTGQAQAGQAAFAPGFDSGQSASANGSGSGLGSGQPAPLRFDEEEEKRLLYVGLTRAKQGLFLSRAARRHLYGRELRLKPSRFLVNLPLSMVKHSAMVAKTIVKQEHLSLF
ncbi:MAG: UvrD-helicase domain-containing protein [Deltaproteobacteria bacterium]|jgi:superfamily I DNA/RNA helicase/PHP family Zn ribbon phosphoesterase|nr:UvrD-helicase domain-containing protein [Deltaproteobacteria bacterium]